MLAEKLKEQRKAVEAACLFELYANVSVPILNMHVNDFEII